MGKAHFNIGSIQGGTHAGWRRITELTSWWCCKAQVKRYLMQCPECGSRRP